MALHDYVSTLSPEQSAAPAASLDYRFGEAASSVDSQILRQLMHLLNGDFAPRAPSPTRRRVLDEM